MNLIDRVLFQCKLNPPAIAIGAPGTNFEIMSYARLERSINNVARRALSQGLAAGDLVALFVREPVLHAIFILALMRLNIVTVSGLGPDLPKELQPDALITDTTYPYRANRLIPAGPDWTLGNDMPLLAKNAPLRAPNDVCRIALTAGKNGDSKAVALTHTVVAARLARHHYIYGHVFPNCTRTYCDIGFATGAGFQYLIYTLSRGGALFLAGDNLKRTVEAVEAYRIENIISSPDGLASLLQYCEQQSSLRSSLDMITCHGRALPKALSEQVRARFSTNLVIYYNATETDSVTSAPAQTIAQFPGAVGYVLPDMTVEIVDQSGQPLPTGKEGIVRIKSPYGVDRYVGHSEQSTDVFRDGWFYPGEVGHLTNDKVLVFAGREKPY